MLKVKRKPIVFRSTLVFILLAAFEILVIDDGILAAESIPDSELETLYGGCGPFLNPYCVVCGHPCPEHAECNADDKCRWSIPKMCYECTYGWSWIPDPLGCDSYALSCPNRPPGPLGDPITGYPETYGFCVELDCFSEYPDPLKTYPDCTDLWYVDCNDGIL